MARMKPGSHMGTPLRQKAPPSAPAVTSHLRKVPHPVVVQWRKTSSPQTALITLISLPQTLAMTLSQNAMVGTFVLHCQTRGFPRHHYKKRKVCSAIGPLLMRGSWWRQRRRLHQVVVTCPPWKRKIISPWPKQTSSRPGRNPPSFQLQRNQETRPLQPGLLSTSPV